MKSDKIIKKAVDFTKTADINSESFQFKPIRLNETV